MTRSIVSPSWRESLAIEIGARELRVARFGRGLRPRVVGSAALPLASTAAVATTLTHALQTAGAKPGMAADVFVSAEWVRVALTSGASSLRGPIEVKAAAAHTLRRVYGEAAAGWRSCATQAGGDRLLVAGIDGTLFDELAATLSTAGLRLQSLVPLFTALLNRLQAELRKPAWFVVAEPTRATLGYTDGRELSALRSHRTGADLASDIPRWIDQCRLQDGIDATGAELIVIPQGVDRLETQKRLPSARVMDAANLLPFTSAVS